MQGTITINDIYKLNKRGRDAADGKSGELFTGNFYPIDDITLIKLAR